MVESIKKVKVTEVSRIMTYTIDNVETVAQDHGVYLIFKCNGSSPPLGYMDRDYCKIGVSVGTTNGVSARLKDSMKKCKPPEDWCFQVLACDTGVDAARLEVLFHLWHRGHKGSGYRPLEPKGVPLAELEPDFFYVESE